MEMMQSICLDANYSHNQAVQAGHRMLSYQCSGVFLIDFCSIPSFFIHNIAVFKKLFYYYLPSLLFLCKAAVMDAANELNAVDDLMIKCEEGSDDDLQPDLALESAPAL